MGVLKSNMIQEVQGAGCQVQGMVFDGLEFVFWILVPIVIGTGSLRVMTGRTIQRSKKFIVHIHNESSASAKDMADIRCSLSTDLFLMTA